MYLYCIYLYYIYIDHVYCHVFFPSRHIPCVSNAPRQGSSVTRKQIVNKLLSQQSRSDSPNRVAQKLQNDPHIICHSMDFWKPANSLAQRTHSLPFKWVQHSLSTRHLKLYFFSLQELFNIWKHECLCFLSKSCRAEVSTCLAATQENSLYGWVLPLFNIYVYKLTHFYGKVMRC